MLLSLYLVSTAILQSPVEHLPYARCCTKFWVPRQTRIYKMMQHADHDAKAADRKLNTRLEEQGPGAEALW